MNENLRLTESPNSETRCAYCHDSINLDDEFCCPSCQIGLHQECREQLTECPTIGCGELVSPSATQVGERVADEDDHETEHEEYNEEEHEAEYENEHENSSNFSNFMYGLKALTKSLPVFFILSALVCMLLGLLIGEIYFQIHDLSRFDGATIIDDVDYKYLRERSRYTMVSQGYLDRIEARRLQMGAFLGFALGIVFRAFYLAIASYGQRSKRRKSHKNDRNSRRST